MERENHIQNELTGQARNAYSNSGGNFMPEPGSGEGTPMPGPERADPGGAPIDRDASSADTDSGQRMNDLLRTYHEHGVGLDNDGLSTLRALADGGITPDDLVWGEEETRFYEENKTPEEAPAPLRESSLHEGDGNRSNPDTLSLETAEEKRNRILREKGFDEAYIEHQEEWEAMARGYMFLTGYEVYQLTTDPGSWLEDKFNQLYDFANRGEEMNSPVVQQISSSFGDAAKLMAREHGALEPELVTEITSEFQTRQNLIFMRSMAEAGNMEALGSLAARVRGEGFFNALDYENGQVGIAYARLLDLYDDVRLAHGGKNFKMTPELEAQIQDILEDEEYHKARVGVGGFSKAYEDAKAKVGEGITPRQKVYLRENKFLKDKGLDLGSSPDEFQRKVDELSPEDKVALDKLLKDVREREIKEKTVREIRRSVRTANDVFQINQRHAVINSRGFSKDPKENMGALEYLGQPGGEFPMYNPEAFLWLQYSIENAHDKEFVDRIKLDMAMSDLKRRGIDYKNWKTNEEYEEWKKEKGEESKGVNFEQYREEQLIEYGTVLFRDLYQVADFYSSGWRVEGTLQHLDKYAEKKGFDAEDFALFMRLKELGPEQKEEKVAKKEKVWDKIAKYRPDIMIKILRERDEARLRPFLVELRESGIEINDADREKGITNEWDKFKATYGSALSTIREMGMNEDPPRRIDFTNLDPEHAEAINKILNDDGAAEKVKEIFGKMQKFARGKRGEGEGEYKKEFDLRKIYSKDVKYADLHTRVYEVDDIPLVKLEKDVVNVGMVPLSKKLSADVRTDSLVRNFNDLGHAGKATSALLKFIKSEDMKTKIEAAMEFAEESSMYGGQKQRGKSIRYTAGTLYFLAKKDKWADVMDFEKGFGRRPISELQRIYGPQAEAIDREELRGHLDEIRILLADAFDADDAEAMYHELEELLEVRGRDIAKLRGEGAFILLLLAAAVIGPSAFKEGLDFSKIPN